MPQSTLRRRACWRGVFADVGSVICCLSGTDPRWIRGASPRLSETRRLRDYLALRRPGLFAVVRYALNMSAIASA